MVFAALCKFWGTSRHCLVVSFWTFFKFFSSQGELERTKTTKTLCWYRGIFL